MPAMPIPSKPRVLWLVLGYIGHNCAAGAAGRDRGADIVVAAAFDFAMRPGSRAIGRILTRRATGSIIQAIVAINWSLGGLIFIAHSEYPLGVFLLFFRYAGADRDSKSAHACDRGAPWIMVIYLVLSLVTLEAAPRIAIYEMERNPNSANSCARLQLARELTQAWRSRFGSRWAVVAGTTEIGEPWLTSLRVWTIRRYPRPPAKFRSSPDCWRRRSVSASPPATTAHRRCARSG